MWWYSGSGEASVSCLLSPCGMKQLSAPCNDIVSAVTLFSDTPVPSVRIQKEFSRYTCWTSCSQHLDLKSSDNMHDELWLFPLHLSITRMLCYSVLSIESLSWKHVKTINHQQLNKQPMFLWPLCFFCWFSLPVIHITTGIYLFTYLFWKIK